jgi:hypothetical protein
MKSVIEPNGNLTFIMEAGDDYDMDIIHARCGGDDTRWLSDMLDTFGFLGNGLETICPEYVGALTDAPMLSDDVELLDEPGKAEVHGRVWWYPQYEVHHFGEVLAKQRRVTFSLAH